MVPLACRGESDIAAWRPHHNEVRLHSSLDYLTLNEWPEEETPPRPGPLLDRSQQGHRRPARKPSQAA
jgi:hypothetical protein